MTPGVYSKMSIPRDREPLGELLGLEMPKASNRRWRPVPFRGPNSVLAVLKTLRPKSEFNSAAGFNQV